MKTKTLSTDQPISYAGWRYVIDVKDMWKLVPIYLRGAEEYFRMTWLQHSSLLKGWTVENLEKKDAKQGRSGITFNRSKKNPQLFIGFITDPEDHNAYDLFKEGVPFALIVEIPKRYWKKLYGTAEWSAFANAIRLRMEAAKWKVFNVEKATIANPNLYHPLIVYRPMVELIKGTPLEIKVSADPKYEADFKWFFQKHADQLLDTVLPMPAFKKFVTFLDKIDKTKKSKPKSSL